MKDKKKILIIDDDERNIFALSAVMRAKGFSLLSAMNGEAGIKALEENPTIDIVLMDIMMPVMDGYRAMELIRKNEKLNHIPIIALTANAMPSDKEKCLRAGATDYLSKPVNVDSLIAKIEGCLKK